MPVTLLIINTLWNCVNLMTWWSSSVCIVYLIHCTSHLLDQFHHRHFHCLCNVKPHMDHDWFSLRALSWFGLWLFHLCFVLDMFVVLQEEDKINVCLEFVFFKTSTLCIVYLIHCTSHLLDQFHHRHFHCLCNVKPHMDHDWFSLRALSWFGLWLFHLCFVLDMFVVLQEEDKINVCLEFVFFKTSTYVFDSWSKLFLHSFRCW